MKRTWSDDYEGMNEHIWQNEWLHWGKKDAWQIIRFTNIILIFFKILTNLIIKKI